jgi:signal transduction histidine kinase
MNRRTRLVYGVLLAVWAIIVVWQVVEHSRVEKDERAKLVKSANDISRTAGVVMRSQQRFGTLDQQRLESALKLLIESGELNGIELWNNAGGVVASAGTSMEDETRDLLTVDTPYWGKTTVAVMKDVLLGTNVFEAVVLPRKEPSNSAVTSRPPGMASDGTNTAGAPPAFPRGPRRPRGGSDGRPFDRFGMTEAQWQEFVQKRGAHFFVTVLSTQTMRATIRRDLWLRCIISILASVSVVGLGLALRTVTRSSDLELRLMRAAELNTRLREMNLAAAGLAHETRNPLNIIRGLAQMIAKQQDSSPEIRQKSREIMDETDRVTAQLSEFIDFSRPREVRRSAVALNSVVGEVVRALGSDLEEKTIRLEVAPDLPRIEADEQLLRQALFNLLINAIQAVERDGEIRVVASKNGGNEARLQIRDNGPGVPPDQRAEVFKPYFTTHPEGTGLGLAVVQQIVLAHGWEIACLPNEPRGAIFQIAHLKLAA